MRLILMLFPWLLFQLVSCHLFLGHLRAKRASIKQFACKRKPYLDFCKGTTKQEPEALPLPPSVPSNRGRPFPGGTDGVDPRGGNSNRRRITGATGSSGGSVSEQLGLGGGGGGFGGGGGGVGVGSGLGIGVPGVGPIGVNSGVGVGAIGGLGGGGFGGGGGGLGLGNGGLFGISSGVGVSTPIGPIGISSGFGVGR